MQQVLLSGPHFGPRRPEVMVDADSVHRVQLRLPAAVLAGLYAYANSMERTVSSVARDAITEYLARQHSDP